MERKVSSKPGGGECGGCGDGARGWEEDEIEDEGDAVSADEIEDDDDDEEDDEGDGSGEDERQVKFPGQPHFLKSAPALLPPNLHSALWLIVLCPPLKYRGRA